MQVELYNFSKKNNSTKLPNLQYATIIECQLKDVTSFLSPIIIVRPNLIPGFSPAAFNYAHIPYWQRYYFITDWVWINAVWECHLALDYMGSFKGYIGDSSQYILRSSYEKDGNISDNVYPIKTEYEIHSTQTPTIYQNVYTAGFYILGIIGKNADASVGAVTYYQMTAAQVAAILNLLLTDTYFDVDIEINPSTLKTIYNPMQYVVSCNWFPFPLSAIPAEFKSQASTIMFGWWGVSTGSNMGYKLLQNVPSISTDFMMSIPTHPQAASRGNYLNHSPFTQHVLKIAPFSDIVLGDQYIDAGDKLQVKLLVDVISGVGMLTVNIVTSENVFKAKIARESQMIGVQIQLAQIGVDYFGSISQMFKDTANLTQTYAGTIGGLASGLVSTATGNLSSGISAGAGYAGYAATEEQLVLAYHYDAIKNTSPQMLTTGHNGSISDYKELNYFISVFYKVADADNARIGSPLCKIRTIKNIPGFIIVQNPTIDINCTDIERKSIIATMAAGFYYE